MPSTKDGGLQLRKCCVMPCSCMRSGYGSYSLLLAANALQGVWLYKVEPSGGRLLGMNKVTHSMRQPVPNGICRPRIGIKAIKGHE